MSKKTELTNICKNCIHRELVEIGGEIETYCYNPDCDIEYSEDEECDNYMGVVEDNDSCKLFESFI